MNIWSRYELEKRRRKAAAERDDSILRRHLERIGPTPFMTPDEIAAARDRTEDDGRRYAVLLLAVRAVHPDWQVDQIRAEAARLLELERPDSNFRVR